MLHIENVKLYHPSLNPSILIVYFCGCCRSVSPRWRQTLSMISPVFVALGQCWSNVWPALDHCQVVVGMRSDDLTNAKSSMCSDGIWVTTFESFTKTARNLYPPVSQLHIIILTWTVMSSVSNIEVVFARKKKLVMNSMKTCNSVMFYFIFGKVHFLLISEN